MFFCFVYNNEIFSAKFKTKFFPDIFIPKNYYLGGDKKASCYSKGEFSDCLIDDLCSHFFDWKFCYSIFDK